MDWTSVIGTFLGALCGAAVPVACFVFWLGGVAEKMRAIAARCEKREKDHCHHYQKLNEHSVRLGNLDTRLVSIEQWRARENSA